MDFKIVIIDKPRTPPPSSDNIFLTCGGSRLADRWREGSPIGRVSAKDCGVGEDCTESDIGDGWGDGCRRYGAGG